MLKCLIATRITIRNYTNISDNIGHFAPFFAILPHFSTKKPIFKHHTQNPNNQLYTENHDKNVTSLKC